jgi:ethanolaminephosphotransferase
LADPVPQITLSGLSLVIMNFATLLYYDPLYLAEKDGATGPPDWMYWVWGVSLFMYQSLDAIDGYAFFPPQILYLTRLDA